MLKEIYSYTKIDNIQIGDINNVFYDASKDVVIITEDRGRTLGTITHSYGSKAKILPEMIDAIEQYNQQKYNERQAMFDRIKKAIDKKE